MNPSRFLACHGALDGECCHQREIAHLEECVCHLGVPVIPVQLFANRGDARVSQTEAVIASNDADIVPHETPDLVPHMGQHDQFVTGHRFARVPIRNRHRQLCLLRLTGHALRDAVCEDQSLQQTIGGKPVGPVQAAASRLAEGVKPRHSRPPEAIHHKPATTIVGCGDDGQRLPRHIDAVAFARRMNVGKVLEDEVLTEMADVEKNVAVAALLEFQVNRPRHDVARCQRSERVVLLHEISPLAILQNPALAAHCFGDEERLGLRVVQARGMELHKLKIGDFAPSTPANGHAIARRLIGVRGVKVHLPMSTRAEVGLCAAHLVDLARSAAQDVRPKTTVFRKVGRVFVRRQKIDRHLMLGDLDIGSALHGRNERFDDGLTREIRRMDHTAMGMPPFAIEMEAPVAFLMGKVHTEVDQLVHKSGPRPDDDIDNLPPAKSGSRNKGVLNMAFERIVFIEDAGNAALSIPRVAIRQPCLGNHEDPPMAGQLQSQHQASNARPDDQMRNVFDGSRFLHDISPPTVLFCAGNALRIDNPRRRSLNEETGLLNGKPRSGGTSMTNLERTKDWLKHMPNKLTIARMAVIPLLLALYPVSNKLWLFCAILFAFAAFTDYLDGWIARRYGSVTPLGALLDPIADKMLIGATLVLLSSSGVVPAFLTGLIICRDIGVSGLRLMAMEQDFKIEVNDFGKWKTALLLVSIFSLLAYEPILGLPLREIGMVTMWVSLVLSLYSAWLYGRAYLAEAKDSFSSQQNQ